MQEPGRPRFARRAGWPRTRSTTGVVGAVAFLSGLYFFLPAISLFWQARGMSLAQISILQAVLMGVGLLLDLPTGALADRFGRRWALSAGLAFQILSECVFLSGHNFWAFVLAQVIGGIGTAVLSGSTTALVYESLPEAQRPAAMQRAMGLIGAAIQLANLIAYVAGGLLIGDLRLDHIILAIQLTILCVCLAFVASLFMPPEHGRHDPRTPRLGTIALIRHGLGLVRRNGRLQRIVLVYLLTYAFSWYLQVLYQGYLLAAGVGGIWLGPALGLGAMLALVGQRYAYTLERWLGVGYAVVLATALPGILYLLMAVINRSWPAVLLFCLLWGAIPIKEPLFAGYLNRHIPNEQRATVLSLVNTLKSIYIALWGLIIGRVAEISLSLLFGAIGILVLGSALLLRIDERHTEQT